MASHQVFRFEHVERGDSLQVNGVVVVVGPERPRREEGHGLVKEASVGRCIGHVGAEVDGGRVDLRVGGHVGDGGQEVVHHARVVRVVDCWTVEPRLQDVGEEEGPAKSSKSVTVWS